MMDKLKKKKRAHASPPAGPPSKRRRRDTSSSSDDDADDDADGDSDDDADGEDYNSLEYDWAARRQLAADRQLEGKDAGMTALAAVPPPAPVLTTPFDQLYGKNWEPGKRHPAVVVEAFRKAGYPVKKQTFKNALDALAVICRDAGVRPPLPQRGLAPTGFVRYVDRLASRERDSTRKKKLNRARHQLKRLRVNLKDACRPTTTASACELCTLRGVVLLKARPHLDRIVIKKTETRRTPYGFAVDYHGEDLVNDHLEWSEEHRCWACKHCNERSIAAADLVDDDEYRLFCRRTRTNNRTFAAVY
jgi:hypothetical protein